MNAMSEKISVRRGDITRVEVDAIVNAANNSLMGGGGVDGAIHRAGGPSILEECRAIVARQGGCNTGDAVITGGGNLPARFVIHTVGPVWTGGENHENEKLSSCYLTSLRLAADNHCTSVAFPNISTGVYGFPKPGAAAIAAEAVAKFLASDERITRVIFVCFDEENFELTRRSVARVINAL
jgi:O-acetyl-ADP-ribose deacetylase